MAPRIRGWWRNHGRRVLQLTVACMVAAALWRIGTALPWLLQAQEGGFDLRLRHTEVHMWFAGWPIYTEAARGDYPPASYAILWPLLGWLRLAPARWLWALTALAALAWLAAMCLRASGATDGVRRLLILLLPFSTYGASAALAVGQLINHVLPFLLAGLLVIDRRRASWRDDLIATGLLLPTLVKPTLSAPFFWFVCFVPGRLRPIVLVSLGYVLLTFLAASFQPGDLTTTLFGWLSERPQVLHGHANVNKLLALVGLRPWMLPVSVSLLAALAVWVARHRRSDPWLLLGVIALVGRFFIHHRLYDDLLLLLPMITLFRIASQGPAGDGSDVAAGALFALVWVSLHAPAQILGTPTVWAVVMEVGQVIIWLAALVFLLDHARRENRRQADASIAPSELRIAS